MWLALFDLAQANSTTRDPAPYKQQPITSSITMARIAGSLVAVLFAAAAASVAAAAGTAEHVKVLSAADFDDSVNDGNVYFIKVGCCHARTCC